MPAIVQSTAAFANGEIVLLSHDCKVNANGLIEVPMSLAFLDSATFTPRNVAKFQKGAPPPVALPDDVKAVGPINGTVYLADHTVKTENGICYAQANYVGTNGRSSQSTTFEIRSYSGYGTAEVELGNNPAKVEITYAVSFDYSVTTTSFEYVSFVAASKNRAIAQENNRWNIKRSISIDDTNYKFRSDPQGDFHRLFTAQPIGPLWIISDTANYFIQSPD